MNTENTPNPAIVLDTYPGADKYPLINDRLYRECLRAVVAGVKHRLQQVRLQGEPKSSPLIQLERSGQLTTGFMLQHFAGIFDRTSPLSSGQRRLVKAILTDAAGMMAEKLAMAKEMAAKETTREKAPADDDPSGKEAEPVK